jgi:mRNA interferase MazF
MNQQDLVWVKLPFSDLKQSKVRPALIVSNNIYNKASPDVIVCGITSKLKEDNYAISIDENDLSEGNLPLKSTIRADKVLQIEKTIVIRPFAKLADRTFDKVVYKIMSLVKRNG